MYVKCKILSTLTVLMDIIYITGYGGNSNMTEAGLLGGCQELGLAWSWCQHAADLVTSGQLRSYVRSGQVRVPGVRSILRSAGGGGSTEVKSSSWSGQ